MTKKGRRRNKNRSSEDEIIQEITRKSQDLDEVKAELKHFRDMWTNASDEGVIQSPSSPPPATSKHHPSISRCYKSP